MRMTHPIGSQQPPIASGRPSVESLSHTPSPMPDPLPAAHPGFTHDEVHAMLVGLHA